MAAVPVLSGREVVRVFESFGWQIARQSGSHIIMTKDGRMASLSIPDHKEVARGTLVNPRQIGRTRISVGIRLLHVE